MPKTKNSIFNEKLKYSTYISANPQIYKANIPIHADCKRLFPNQSGKLFRKFLLAFDFIIYVMIEKIPKLQKTKKKLCEKIYL